MAEFVVTNKGRQKAATQAAPGAARPQTGPGSGAQPAVTMVMNHDQIAKLAYDIWVRKGRPQGQAQQHWYEAETALRAQPKARA